MSTRVRLFGIHPRYGVNYGPFLKKYVTESFRAKYKGIDPVQYAPLYGVWPVWKRIIWMAKFEGTWQIYAFREPRHANIKRSLYGQQFLRCRIPFPVLAKNKKPKKAEAYKAVMVPANPVVVANPPGNDWMWHFDDNPAANIAQAQQPGAAIAQAQAAQAPPFEARAQEYVQRQLALVEQARQRVRRRPIVYDYDDHGPEGM